MAFEIILLKDLNSVDLKDYNVHCNLTEKRVELKAFEGVVPILDAACVFKEKDGTISEITYFLCVLNVNNELIVPTKKSWNQLSFSFSLARQFSNNKEYYHEYLSQYGRENPCPNFVTKPTAKKLGEWVEYLLKQEEFLLNRYKEKINFRENYLNKLKEEGRKFNIITDKEGFLEGEIQEKGLIFKFQVYENSVHTCIEASYHLPNSIETFDKMVNALS
jgi:disulfide oxidoreductase YuzD